MRITEKVLLLFLPTFMLSVVTMTLLSRRAAEQILIEDVALNGRALGINLAQSREMVESFRGGDERLLLPPLQQVQANTTAEYAMVLGLEGRVLAHTDVSQKGKVYDDEASRRAVNSNVPLQSELVVGGRRVMDVSCPVWEILGAEEGEAFLRLGPSDGTGAQRLGTIRLGLPLDRALDTADRISKQVLWIVTVINIIAMGISLFYVRKILRPVRLMAAATERIAAGELGASVPVMSRDEMGELAHSFNRMSQELATTMVSVDFLDNILNNMRDVLVVTNADGSVRRVNRAALELLDYDEGDVIGRSASRLFSEAAGSLFTAQSIIDMAREGCRRSRGGHVVQQGRAHSRPGQRGTVPRPRRRGRGVHHHRRRHHRTRARRGAYPSLPGGEGSPAQGDSPQGQEQPADYLQPVEPASEPDRRPSDQVPVQRQSKSRAVDGPDPREIISVRGPGSGRLP
jgi:HAMP domain-containing protein